MHKKNQWKWSILVAAIIIAVGFVGIRNFLSNEKPLYGETVETIKTKIKLGLSKEEVKSSLGDDITAIKNSMDDSEMWRYDIEAKENYTSPDDEYDMGDIEGLKNGELKIQLFIQWNSKDTVEWYSALYLNESDGKVYDYRVMSNGEAKEKAITK